MARVPTNEETNLYCLRCFVVDVDCFPAAQHDILKYLVVFVKSGPIKCIVVGSIMFTVTDLLCRQNELQPDDALL